MTSTDEIIIDNDGTVDSVANSLISNPQPEDEAADLEEPEAIEDSEDMLCS